MKLRYRISILIFLISVKLTISKSSFLFFLAFFRFALVFQKNVWDIHFLKSPWLLLMETFLPRQLPSVLKVPFSNSLLCSLWKKAQKRRNDGEMLPKRNKSNVRHLYSNTCTLYFYMPLAFNENFFVGHKQMLLSNVFSFPFVFIFFLLPFFWALFFLRFFVLIWNSETMTMILDGVVSGDAFLGSRHIFSLLIWKMCICVLGSL